MKYTILPDVNNGCVGFTGIATIAEKWRTFIFRWNIKTSTLYHVERNNGIYYFVNTTKLLTTGKRSKLKSDSDNIYDLLDESKSNDALYFSVASIGDVIKVLEEHGLL